MTLSSITRYFPKRLQSGRILLPEDVRRLTPNDSLDLLLHRRSPVAHELLRRIRYEYDHHCTRDTPFSHMDTRSSSEVWRNGAMRTGT